VQHGLLKEVIEMQGRLLSLLQELNERVGILENPEVGPDTEPTVNRVDPALVRPL
jgi:hypothetical protein